MEYNEQKIAFDIVSDSQLTINYPQTFKDSKKLKVLSLFSGCGGMDLGFEGNFIAPFNENEIIRFLDIRTQCFHSFNCCSYIIRKNYIADFAFFHGERSTYYCSVAYTF